MSAVAVNIYELAVSPGFDAIGAMGGLRAFTGWRGLMVQVARWEAAGTAPAAAGWRSRRRPALVSEEPGAVRLRSAIDGSIHAFDVDELSGEADRMGAVRLASALATGARLHWWDSADDVLPGDGWVVSEVPAAAGRAGFYWTAGGWRAVAEIADAAQGGPLLQGCECRTCTIARCGYIAHLWRQQEITAAHLLGWHNLHQARLAVEDSSAWNDARPHAIIG
ncbi:MAG: hypothetical protein NVSMB17_15860 [Candidatus Dormibacteria bacterium]